MENCKEMFLKNFKCSAKKKKHSKTLDIRT